MWLDNRDMIMKIFTILLATLLITSCTTYTKVSSRNLAEASDLCKKNGGLVLLSVGTKTHLETTNLDRVYCGDGAIFMVRK